MTTETLEVFLDHIFYNKDLRSARISFDNKTSPIILKEYLDEKYSGWKRVSMKCGLIEHYTTDLLIDVITMEQLSKYYLEVAFI